MTRTEKDIKQDMLKMLGLLDNVTHLKLLQLVDEMYDLGYERGYAVGYNNGIKEAPGELDESEQDESRE